MEPELLRHRAPDLGNSVTYAHHHSVRTGVEQKCPSKVVLRLPDSLAVSGADW
jgi:hypothetical protein